MKSNKDNREKPYQSEEDWYKEIAHLKWPTIIIIIIILALFIYFQFEFNN